MSKPKAPVEYDESIVQRLPPGPVPEVGHWTSDPLTYTANADEALANATPGYTRACARCYRQLPLGAFPTSPSGTGMPRTTCLDCLTNVVPGP